MNHLEIDTDRIRLDTEFIHRFISRSYWAAGRSLEQVRRLADHSLNFGLYLDGRQIGYARLVSDFGQFAYLMDVFVDEAHRRKGYAGQLVRHILEHPSLREVKTWRLATTDAHGLYRKFGFAPLARPESMMERVLP